MIVVGHLAHMAGPVARRRRHLAGLTDGELIEALLDPLLDISEIKTDFGRLQGQAWYLFQGVD